MHWDGWARWLGKGGEIHFFSSLSICYSFNLVSFLPPNNYFAAPYIISDCETGGIV